MENLRYPVGKFKLPEEVTTEDRERFMGGIAGAPALLRRAVKGLTPEQLDTPYRPGGWTVRQVVHHVPDSHLNSYIRFKLALTEDEPVIKPYFEDRWAELEDTRQTPIEVSLTLLESLHERWVTLLRSLSEQELKRTFRHPEIGAVRLEQNIALYAWHGRHHVGHITNLRKSKGWD